ncbi:MAG: hypothetical protein HY267_07110 [Deltaproteobacteria bacterium]|nr:hypothetical protein [Deltaproteobacteria bacterium]
MGDGIFLSLLVLSATALSNERASAANRSRLLADTSAETAGGTSCA